jgi:hypothetical protein
LIFTWDLHGALPVRRVASWKGLKGECRHLRLKKNKTKKKQVRLIAVSGPAESAAPGRNTEGTIDAVGHSDSASHR